MAFNQPQRVILASLAHIWICTHVNVREYKNFGFHITNQYSHKKRRMCPQLPWEIHDRLQSQLTHTRYDRTIQTNFGWSGMYDSNIILVCVGAVMSTMRYVNLRRSQSSLSLNISQCTSPVPCGPRIWNWICNPRRAIKRGEIHGWMYRETSRNDSVTSYDPRWH